jgi:hypothetical protein
MQLRRRPLGLVLVIVLCGSLVFAAPASAKVAQYVAPLPVGGPDDSQSWIEFRVKLKKNQRTKKFQPVAVKKLELFFVVANCTDGEPARISGPWRDLIPLQNRRFSFSDTSGDSTLEFSGRVPRNGPPKGTLRVVFTNPGQAPPGEPVPPDATCDTGKVPWTGERVSLY